MTERTMSAEQRDKIAASRRETRAVESYLAYLELAPEQQRTVRRGPELRTRLAAIETDIEGSRGLERLGFLQERENLERALAETADVVDPDELEAAFIAVARSFSDRKGVSYSTWREFGVPKKVLDAAGVPRTRRPNRRSLDEG